MGVKHEKELCIYVIKLHWSTCYSLITCTLTSLLHVHVVVGGRAYNTCISLVLHVHLHHCYMYMYIHVHVVVGGRAYNTCSITCTYMYSM